MIHGDLSDCSFRDPSGFVFRAPDGKVYRQINTGGSEDYSHFIKCGLYDKLVGNGLLVSHREVDNISSSNSSMAYKIICPEQVLNISYPYEWCFSQFKDAALLTLAIQKMAFEHGMTLKDASAFNIQFVNCKPVFIDTLSFAKYKEGSPWEGYKQFCQHFLAPLALMSYCDIRLGKLGGLFIDGVPLDIASKLLPVRSRFSAGILMHIHLLAKAQARYADDTEVKAKTSNRKMSKFGFIGIIESLEKAVRKLKWKEVDTEWGDYYNNTNYSDDSMTAKKNIISGFLKESAPASVWDLGANTGIFSRLASDMGADTVAFDIDPVAVEKNYLAARKNDENILPLQLDLTNPSSAIGWNNSERMSFVQRGPVDVVMALALIHHLAISNNVPLEKLAEFFSGISRSLIIEFVPKGDSQVKKLLATREDIFPDYTQSGFENAFKVYFDVIGQESIPGSERTLYLMRNKGEK